MYMFLFLILYSTFTKNVLADKPCIQKKFNYSSIVCVCNSTYCDEIDEIKPLPKGQYVLYSSSQGGLRFRKKSGNVSDYSLFRLNIRNDIIVFLTYISTGKTGDVVLKVDKKKYFQKIIGFGGATTDSSAILIKQLSKGAGGNLLRSYFGNTGIEYNILRTPIAGTDFSPQPYAYNLYPKDDLKLSNFSLVEEDLKYKIPLIRNAQKLCRDDMLLLATAWGPPPWMKTLDHYGGPSRLKKRYYQTWADYHLRYLEEYDKQGIKYWAITPGNEPSNGIFGFDEVISLGWGMKEYVMWLGNHFGPTIRNSKFSYVKILVLDENKLYIPWALEWIVNDKKASKYFDGISLHWYDDHLVPKDLTDSVHYAYPDKFIIMTEASYGGDNIGMTRDIRLGSWLRAEWYFSNIILNLNHWFTGWMDWNLCLDEKSGPSWSTNHVDASIVVNIEKDEFYKQPMYYAIGHFSKFLPRESVRIDIKLVEGDIDHVGFLRPDGGIVVIFYNRFSNKRQVIIYEEGEGFIEFTISGRSFHTILYW